FGVPPAKIVDLLALVGDTSDNIPGVPKIGEKTAVELMRQFGSLDEILARLDEVKKPAIRQSLAEHREDALLSRRLVTLHTDVELPCRVEDLPPPRPKRAALEALFRELEFDSLLATLPPDEDQKPLATAYTTVATADDLARLVADLRAAGTF